MSHQLDPSIPSLLSGLSATIETANSVRRTYDQSLAIEFNPLMQFFSIGENKLSSILAYFLDPAEKHGQGDTFLRIFLDDFLPNGKSLSYSNARVKCEHSTPDSRRLDIYINLDDGKFGIGIENKIWARDQHNQILDYSKYLQQFHNENYCLIYLTPYHKEPDESSISQESLSSLKVNGGYVCRDHSTDLLNLLEKWVAACQAEKVRIFLKDLFQQIQYTINGEKIMGENELIADYVLSKEEHFKSSMAISRAEQLIYEKIFAAFQQQIENVSRDLDLTLVDYTMEWSGKSYTWFTLAVKEAGTELWLRFQFDKTWHQDFYWGVLSDGTLHPELSHLLREHLGDGKSSEHWLWWNWHENRHWDDDVYIAIYNGTFALKIKQLLGEILPKVKAAISENPSLIWVTKDVNAKLAQS